jgi:pentatricopeptide repeat protein
VERFYDNYRAIIEAGGPFARKLLGSTHIYNAVLMAFGRFPQSLPMCPAVVMTMLKDASSSPSTSPSPALTTLAPHSHSNFVHPAPDIHTWSILLNIYMQHQQPRVAERVLEHMETRGIEPNLVTWNSLAGGYAALQDTMRTAHVVRRLKERGVKADKVTMKALKRIKDKRSLIHLMRLGEEFQAKEGEKRENEALEGLRRVIEFEKVGEIAKWEEGMKPKKNMAKKVKKFHIKFSDSVSSSYKR